MQNESLDTNDIVNVLKSIEVSNYIKSVLDNKDTNGLYLHEFAIKYKDIKYVYIKFKLIDGDIVIKVISFHQNEYEFSFAFDDN